MITIRQTSVAVLATLALATVGSSHAAPPAHSNANPNASSNGNGNGNPGATAANPAPEQWARGRILVEPRAGLPAAALDAILKEHRGKGRKVGQSNLHVVDLEEHGSEKSVVEKLSRHPHIKFAEIDRVVAPNFVPNDPYFGSETHLAVIGASSAWNVSQGAGIVIAILDSGVDAAHPDLAAQLVPGYNTFDNNSNTADVFGHGTAVAGAAAAATNNGQGVAGVAGQAKIMPVRITDTSGYGYYSTIAQGLTWAADRGARVANCSFDGLANSSAIQSAAQYMKGKGGLVIVAAGNSGASQNIASTTAMVPVSATDNNDARASWSSYGSYVAMSAPGTMWTTSRGGTYQQWQGTSFSSPLTAGVVALMMSANPALDSSTVEGLLYSTAVDLGTPGRDVYFGWGRVNAAAAVQGAAAASRPADSAPPTVAISAPLGNSTVAGMVSVNVSANDNIGVARVELAVGGTTVAVDSAAPFGFSWDSNGVPNGMATLIATAFDAAGNTGVSTPISVNVANNALPVVKDTTPPLVAIANPQPGRVTGNVAISVNASDNAGAAGISLSLYIDGALKATGSGATLATNWNTRKVKAGVHTIAAVAKDAAGNTTTTAVQVTK